MTKQPLLISVVGQTATGKTGLALRLAKQLLDQDLKKIILLSADSKQVFQGLEILTGADIPQGYQQLKNDQFPYAYWQNDKRNIELHGVACVSGDEEWSVAHLQKLFHAVRQKINTKSAIIVVGGTGLYHQQLFQPTPTTLVKPNQLLREKLGDWSLAKLQTKLRKVWPARWKKMNQSDQANPRRLVRAIEVAETKPTKQRLEVYQPTVQLGLQLPIKTVQEKIALRVEQRLEQGIMREVQQFELHHPDKNLQAKQALGYHMILGYLNGHLTLDQLKAVWALEELRYAKRQQTWWKKRPEITWLMGNQAGLEKNAWKIVLSGLEQAGL